MSVDTKNVEVQDVGPDPGELLSALDAIEADEKKFTYLREKFLRVLDVDDHIHFLDTDEDLDMTKKNIRRLEALRAMGLSDEEVKRLADKIMIAIKAILKAYAETGVSFREATQKGHGLELSPEEIDEYLEGFKKRFEAFPKLHPGIKWVDVEKALRADPESMVKLRAFDKKGHKMNVFGKEDGEFVFVSAWNNPGQLSKGHINVCFDAEGQKMAEKKGYKTNGNAVSIIAAIMGVNEKEARNYLADPKFHEQLINAVEVNGWAWLKTYDAIRKAGYAVLGLRNGCNKYNVIGHSGDGSFRALLRVKKA